METATVLHYNRIIQMIAGVEALARDWQETEDLSLGSGDLNESKSMTSICSKRTRTCIVYGSRIPPSTVRF